MTSDKNTGSIEKTNLYLKKKSKLSNLLNFFIRKIEKSELEKFD